MSTPKYVVGSAEDCDIRITDDPYVSTHHCALTVDSGKVRVDDEVKASVLAANPALTEDQADQVVVFVRVLQQEADKTVNEILAHLAEVLERKAAEAPNGALAPGLAVAVQVIRVTMETT